MPNHRELRLWKYNISKERYLYLHHYCKQYVEWKSRTAYGLNAVASDGMPRGNKTSNPVEQAAFRNMKYLDGIKIIEDTAKEADAEIAQYILNNVTRGTTYEYMNVPCGRNRFYRSRKKFFYILDLKMP